VASALRWQEVTFALADGAAVHAIAADTRRPLSIAQRVVAAWLANAAARRAGNTITDEPLVALRAAAARLACGTAAQSPLPHAEPSMHAAVHAQHGSPSCPQGPDSTQPAAVLAAAPVEEVAPAPSAPEPAALAAVPPVPPTAPPEPDAPEEALS
jgi:hypothetical protein